MTVSGFRVNTPGMVAISNEVNAKVAGPIGDSIAAQTGGIVRTDPRTSRADWAHTYVETPNWYEERATGALVRALGQAKR